MKGRNMSDISKPEIDITMTAVLRPAVLSETLASIKEKICSGEDDRYRLIINIDPIGENVQPKSVIKTAKKNFSNVVYNIASTPSFPQAVKWVWKNSTAPYIFHIEDDWLINQDIDIDKMISILDRYIKLSSLRLYKYKTTKAATINTFGCKWDYQLDGFYLARDWKKQFGLNPILIKREFIEQALPLMKDDVNPEKQFRYSQEYMKKVISNWQYGIYSYPSNAPVVVDIGRRWINNTSFSKPVGTTFLTWVKK